MTDVTKDIDNLADALLTMEISPEINDLMEKLALNLTSSNNLPVDVKHLLTSIKTYLTQSSSEMLDYNLLLEVLDAVVGLCPFEDVLKVFSVDDLITALKSGDKALTETVCQVIAAASPRDIFAGTPLLDEMLKLYFCESTVVAIVNALEKTLGILVTNQLNRRRILENNLPVLISVKDCKNSTTFCRFLDLIKILSASVTFEEFRKDIFIIDNMVTKKMMENDILVFIHICQYYIELLTISLTEDGKEWVIRYVKPSFEIFGEAFSRREELFDVGHFAKSYLLTLFSKISYLDDKSYIQVLEAQFFPLYPDKQYLDEFLTVLDPSYIAKVHLDLLKEKALRAGNVHMFVNLIKDEDCFVQLKDEINSKTLNDMPYIEKMLLLDGLTLTSYGIQHLTRNMPSVMNSIIDSGNQVTEKLSFDLRLRVFENLLEANPQELSVWLIPLQSEYANILNGRRGRFSSGQLADDYL